MKPPTRLPLLLRSKPSPASPYLLTTRHIHTNPSQPANVVPVYGTGPPPEPPKPAAHDAADPRIARRRRQAEMLKQAKDLRSAANKSAGGGGGGGGGGKSSSPLKKRFWTHVHVHEAEDKQHLHLSLDTRPLRHPTTKAAIGIPASKPHLAAALALEWDLLTSAREATRQHLIPLTSLVCRALDIAADDDEAAAAAAAAASAQQQNGIAVGPIREAVAAVLLRYLDTDSLLCLAPPANPALQSSTVNEAGETLRAVQERVAAETTAWLAAHVWPGVTLEPVLDGESIVPRPQRPGVREVVQGWVTGLDAWELAGLERGVLASKSLLTAARLVAQWSEGDAGVGRRVAGGGRFGVEEAARAASVEVDWQIGRWGEVEDTHDVEKEDLRRQLGSVVLLVSGTGARG